MGAIVIALVLLVVGTSLLLAGADWFMDGAGDLARAFGVSALLLGVYRPQSLKTARLRCLFRS